MPCEDATDASAILTAALAGPKRVRGDAGEVEQYDLKDLIEAHRYISGQCASTGARRGIRFTKLIPGGTA